MLFPLKFLIFHSKFCRKLVLATNILFLLTSNRYYQFFGYSSDIVKNVLLETQHFNTFRMSSIIVSYLLLSVWYVLFCIVITITVQDYLQCLLLQRVPIFLVHYSALMFPSLYTFVIYTHPQIRKTIIFFPNGCWSLTEISLLA